MGTLTRPTSLNSPKIQNRDETYLAAQPKGMAYCPKLLQQISASLCAFRAAFFVSPDLRYGSTHEPMLPCKTFSILITK